MEVTEGGRRGRRQLSRAVGVRFRGAQLARLGSIHLQLKPNCKLERSIEIVKDRSYGRGGRKKQKMKMKKTEEWKTE